MAKKQVIGLVYHLFGLIIAVTADHNFGGLGAARPTLLPTTRRLTRSSPREIFRSPTINFDGEISQKQSSSERRLAQGDKQPVKKPEGQKVTQKSQSTKNPAIEQVAKLKSEIGNQKTVKPNKPDGNSDCINALQLTSTVATAQGDNSDWTSLYECVEGGLIGEGAFGKVYKIKDLKVAVNPWRAMKVSKITPSASKESLEKEYENASKLNSPLFIKLFRWKSNEKKVIGVMEFAPDGEFFDTALTFMNILTKSEYSQVLLFYIEQMLLAVYQLEQQGLVNRDIKMENMVLDGHRLKMIDMGFVVPKGSKVEFRGTFQYADPAAVNLKELAASCHGLPTPKGVSNPAYVWDVHSDLYSVGMVIATLFTGMEVFETALENYRQDCRTLMASHVDPFIFLGAKVHLALIYVLSQTLQFDPKDRAPVWELIYAIHTVGLEGFYENKHGYLLLTNLGRVKLIKEEHRKEAEERVKKWIADHASDPAAASLVDPNKPTMKPDASQPNRKIVDLASVRFEKFDTSFIDTEALDKLYQHSNTFRRRLLQKKEIVPEARESWPHFVDRIAPLLVLVGLLISAFIIIFKTKNSLGFLDRKEKFSEDLQESETAVHVPVTSIARSP